MKFNSQNSLPVKKKGLNDILNPQPDAQVVIHRLLNWMDRVDLAAQAGDPRPFCSKQPTVTTSYQRTVTLGG